MEKIENKPDKYDLRWRLVYPVIYYDEIRKFAEFVKSKRLIKSSTNYQLSL